jgi:hypothetical protein
MCPDHRDPHDHATDQNQCRSQDYGDERCRWWAFSSWMRDHAWGSETEDLDAGEDKQKRDGRDPQKHDADQSQRPHLFGLRTIERWQPGEQKQSTQDRDDVRRDGSNVSRAFWARKKEDERRCEDRADGTS